MKTLRQIFFLATALLSLTGINGAELARPVPLLDGRVSVSEATMSAEGKSLRVEMTVNLSSLKLQKEQMCVLIPEIISTDGTVTELPKITLMGDQAAIRAARQDGKKAIEGQYTLVGSTFKTVFYNVLIPRTPQNVSGQLAIKTLTKSNFTATPTELPLAKVQSFKLKRPVFTPRYICAVPGRKEFRKLERSRMLNLDFEPGKAKIDTDLPLTLAELDSITAYIKDAVKSRRQINKLTVKASITPAIQKAELTLRKNRAKAIKQYIDKNFPSLSNITVAETENDEWAAVARWVERSSIENRDEILEIITTGDPNQRMANLRKQYRDQANFLQDVIFPVLENFSLSITSTVPVINSLNEIETVYKSNPDDLGAYELCTYCRHLSDKNSDMAAQVAMKAYDLYPESAEVCINAANACLSRNNLSEGRRLLNNAGNSPQAMYALGNWAALSGDYDNAREYFKKALAGGLTESQSAIHMINSITEY